VATVLRRLLFFIGAVALASVALVVSALPDVRAAVVSGVMTGYANGNLTGSDSSVELSNGHFANHPSSCTGDPAAAWPYGSLIVMYDPGWVPEHYDSAGHTAGFSYLYLHDIGDLNCSQGNYWADVYFGRWIRSGESCDCPGSPSPGVCYISPARACDDAIVWGSAVRQYNTP